MKPLTAMFCAAALTLPGGCGEARLAETDGVYAPGVAGEARTDGLVVGHRMMAAGQYELALEAFSRAALQHGMTAEVLSALGSANLKLGRLNQSERLLRRAVDKDPDYPAAWNNLGVVLMERGKVAEAAEVFRRGFATSNGRSDVIRDNLRLALAKRDGRSYGAAKDTSDFRLIRRGTGDFLLQPDS